MKLIFIFFLAFTNAYLLPRLYHRCIFSNTKDIFHYGSEERKNYKKILKIKGYVQDHHCIPYQYRNHPLIRQINFNINSSANLLIMPNKKGIINLNLSPELQIHDGGHPSYNSYIGKELEIIYKEKTLDMKKYKFWLFLSFLKDNLQYNKEIPW